MADKFKGELDPQIAELLTVNDGQENGTNPDFGTLSGEAGLKVQNQTKAAEKFHKIKIIEEKPKPLFNDKDFYKKAIQGEGESTKRVHDFLTQFLNAKDPQDKSMYRARLIPAFWDLASSISGKISMKLPLCKILLLRYGILSPSLITPPQQEMLSKIILNNKTGHPLYYIDEWLKRIASGEENISATDELKRTQKDSNQKILDKMDQTKGQRDSEILLLKNKLTERDACENQLVLCVKNIMNHPAQGLEGLGEPYSGDQKRSMTSINEILRKLGFLDRDISRSYNTLQNLEQNINMLNKKADGVQVTAVDSEQVISEFNTIRQMSKLCVGRKGNHFPILMKHYLRPNIRDLGIRENIINELAFVESLDAGLFLRTYKNQTTRIIPNILILPNFGEKGICWEPFERKNRSSSRGRVAIPLYPKNLHIAVISACADLRWQVAKEKALHYWMEEGITGNYYQWFQNQKLRGDVKEYFINDYILWITRESEGTQKLDRTVRGIFWRLMPFPQELKDKLRNRGYVYNELFKKDINISKSDGY
ncbi:MAG: hypothetical protein JXB88_05150 [Spirochaetales bacterium]|nr:hypothetical protein [Spirochaetales bacterium]